MERTVVIGTSCSGKTVFAAQLATRLGCGHIELDQLFWLPGWQAREREDFRAKVLIATEPSRWVVDGNYGLVRDITWRRATDIVWLDFPFLIVFGRALRRSVKRILTREPLFAGNRETLQKTFLSRESILLWVLRTYRRRRREYPSLFRQPSHSHLKIHRLHSPGEASRFLSAIAGPERQSMPRWQSKTGIPAMGEDRPGNRAKTMHDDA